MAFIFLTDYGEPSGLAIRLQKEGEEAIFCFFDKKYDGICGGIIEKCSDWHVHLGKRNIFILDGCGHWELVEWLRSQGELAIGGTTGTDEFENDRELGEDIFREYGITVPRAKRYQSFDDAITDIRKNPLPLVFKQQGDVPKGLSYVGKFDDGTDMVDRLEHYKTVWHEDTDGPIDFLLQEKVEGHEVAATAFFNGEDWIRDSRGHVAALVNFEGKKLLDGDLGDTTGETTTMAFATTEKNKLFNATLAKLGPYLKENSYKGAIDINTIVTDKGKAYAIEPSMRFGIPTLDLILGAYKGSMAEVLSAIAEGRQPEDGLDFNPGWHCVVVVYAPPFPYETHGQENQGAGQRIYFLKDGEWTGEDCLEDTDDIRPYEVKLENGKYRLTGDCGYVLTVTASGGDHREAAYNCICRIEDKLYFSGMGYRLDAGSRLDDHIEDLMELGYIGPLEGMDPDLEPEARGTKQLPWEEEFDDPEIIIPMAEVDEL